MNQEHKNIIEQLAVFCREMIFHDPDYDNCCANSVQMHQAVGLHKQLSMIAHSKKDIVIDLFTYYCAEHSCENLDSLANLRQSATTMTMDDLLAEAVKISLHRKQIKYETENNPINFMFVHLAIDILTREIQARNKREIDHQVASSKIKYSYVISFLDLIEEKVLQPGLQSKSFLLNALQESYAHARKCYALKQVGIVFHQMQIGQDVDWVVESMLKSNYDNLDRLITLSGQYRPGIIRQECTKGKRSLEDLIEGLNMLQSWDTYTDNTYVGRSQLLINYEGNIRGLPFGSETTARLKALEFLKGFLFQSMVANVKILPIADLPGLIDSIRIEVCQLCTGSMLDYQLNTLFYVEQAYGEGLLAGNMHARNDLLAYFDKIAGEAFDKILSVDIPELDRVSIRKHDYKLFSCFERLVNQLCISKSVSPRSVAYLDLDTGADIDETESAARPSSPFLSIGG